MPAHACRGGPAHGNRTESLRRFRGDHSKIGVVLISDGLRLGLKDCGSLRKQARFLLESAVQHLVKHGNACIPEAA